MASLALKAQKQRPLLKVKTLPVANNFFGGNVNVSGLLTGQDLATAAKNVGGANYDAILLPGTSLKHGDNIFLDDMTLSEFAARFGHAKVFPVANGAEYKRILYSLASDTP